MNWVLMHGVVENDISCDPLLAERTSNAKKTAFNLKKLSFPKRTKEVMPHSSMPHETGCLTLVILKLQVSWSLVTSNVGTQPQCLRSKFQPLPSEGCYVYTRVNCREEVGEKGRKVQLCEHICSLSQE